MTRRWGVFFTTVALVAASGGVGGSGTARAAGICQDLSLEMSDGIRLYAQADYGADLSPKPTVFRFTPYSDFGADGCPRPSLPVPVPAGAFAVIAANWRGAGASEGTTDLLGPRMQQDGREVLDWIADQPWSDGRVVLSGFSAPALIQPFLLSHPAVVGAYNGSTCLDLFQGCQDGTIIGLGLATLGTAPVPLMAEERIALGHANYGAPVDPLAQLVLRDTNDEWWQERSGLLELQRTRPDKPIFSTTGFLDVPLSSAYLGYHSNPNPYLITGLGHNDREILALPRYKELALDSFRRFIDAVVAGKDASEMDLGPRVVLTTSLGGLARVHQGQVVLRSENDYPVPGTRWTKLYVRSGPSGSASSLNDGLMSLGPPEGAEGSDTLVVAPVTGPRPWERFGSAAGDLPDEIRGTRPAQDEERAALTYTTAELTANVELTGPMALRVFASSTAARFDWDVFVTDLWPDGTSEVISDGYARASFRRIDEDRSWYAPDGTLIFPFHPSTEHEQVPVGDIVEYVIGINPTSNVFQAGHRIRLDVFGAGAAQPSGPRSGSTPGAVTILHDQDHPSSLLVGVVPDRCHQSEPLHASVPPLAPCTTLQAALGG